MWWTTKQLNTLNIPYQGSVQIAIGGTTQSSCECRRMGHSDVQRRVYCSSCNNWLWFSSPIVAQTHPPGHPVFKYITLIANWSHVFHPRDFEQSIWLDLIPTCTLRLQGRRVKRRQHQGLVGFMWCWWMVFGSVIRPLLLWFILYTRNKSSSSIGVHRAVPLTLPAIRHDAASALLCPNRWVSWMFAPCRRNSQGLPLVETAATMYQHYSASPSSCWRSKGEGWSTWGRIKGDWWYTHHHNSTSYGRTCNHGITKPDYKASVDKYAKNTLAGNMEQHPWHYPNQTHIPSARCACSSHAKVLARCPRWHVND